MERKVETKVGVANRGGGHREDTEPEPAAPEYLFVVLSLSVGLAVPGERLELGVGVEERGWDDVEDDGTEDDESSSVSVALHHESDEAGHHQAAHCVPGQAEPVSQTTAGLSEPSVDLQHATDSTDTTSATQKDSQPQVERDNVGKCGDDDSKEDDDTADDTHGLMGHPVLQSLENVSQ